MSIRRALQWVIVLVLCVAVSRLPLSAGSMIVGSAIEGTNASIAERNLRPGATLLNGDSLRVEEDGRAVVGLADGSRLSLSKNTTVSFQSDPGAITAVM